MGIFPKKIKKIVFKNILMKNPLLIMSRIANRHLLPDHHKNELFLLKIVAIHRSNALLHGLDSY
jgi:hypothetical protein